MYLLYYLYYLYKYIIFLTHKTQYILRTTMYIILDKVYHLRPFAVLSTCSRRAGAEACF